MAGFVKQRINLGHAHALGPAGDPRDVVASLHFAFLQHTEIKPGSAVLDHQRGHFRLVHPDAKPVTGHTRLRHLEQGAADPVAVSDTDLGIWQAIDGEILSELPIDEVVSSQMAQPVAIGIHLIDKYCPAFAAMAIQVTLSVAVNVEPAHHARTFNRRLPNSGVHGLALPGNVARQAHIDRKQASHYVSQQRRKPWLRPYEPPIVLHFLSNGPATVVTLLILSALFHSTFGRSGHIN